MAMTDYEITAEDIKQIQAALPIIRAMALAEPLLRKVMQMPDLMASIKRLEAQRAGLTESLAAERAASVRTLEAALEQGRQAAAVEASRVQEVADGKILAAEGRLESLKRDEEGLRAGLAQTRTRLEAELETIKQATRQSSEAAAKEVGLARTEAAQIRGTLAKDREALTMEKLGLEQDIARLQDQKKRIAEQLKAALG